MLKIQFQLSLRLTLKIAKTVLKDELGINFLIDVCSSE